MTENSAQANMSAQENETGTTSRPTREPLHIGGLELNSRLTMGTGGATSMDTLECALMTSGTELTTVAMHRLTPGIEQSVFEILQHNNIVALPNTAGCYTARDAVLTAQLAHEALETNLLKLKVIADEDMLLPDPVELIAVAEQLVADGFIVFAYANDDPTLARRLENSGYMVVMPAGSPIGTGLGILNPRSIELIMGRASVPIILDAGIGTASEAARAMELGCDTILLVSAIARAHDPMSMAATMRFGVEAGLTTRESGHILRRRLARASSPFEGIITERINGAREQDSL